MRSYFIEGSFTRLQNNIYSKLNNSNKIAGRFCSIPISILDVGLETLKRPLSAIESVAMVAINLIGAAFSNECALGDALSHTISAGEYIAFTPLQFIMAPFELVFQLFAGMINPKNAKSINSYLDFLI